MGVASVRLTEGEGRREIGSGLEYEYYVAASVSDVYPRGGTVSGGTLVSVSGSGLSGGDVACRFGTVVVSGAGAQVLSSSLVACVSPSASSAGGVAVEVSLNGGVDFTSDNVQYVYGARAAVSEIVPSVGLSGVAGQVVTVIGSDFLHDAALSCRFGVAGVVSAYYQSSSHVLCTAPVGGGGNLSVSVSNNGLDWSSSSARFEAASVVRASMTPSAGPSMGGLL